MFLFVLFFFSKRKKKLGSWVGRGRGRIWETLGEEKEYNQIMFYEILKNE